MLMHDAVSAAHDCSSSAFAHPVHGYETEEERQERWCRCSTSRHTLHNTISALKCALLTSLHLVCRYETEEERQELVPMLRDVSRQEYLRKREEAKLKELEDELQDAKYLFEGVELTAREKADLAYKEQVGGGSDEGRGVERRWGTSSACFRGWS